MKTWMLANRKTRETYERDRFIEEAERQGINFSVVYADEVDLIEAEIQDLELKKTRLTLIGAEREIGHLVEIWQAFPHKFTRAEIEAAQPDYWKARLIGNAEAMLLGGQGVNPAHIEAMAQAGVLEEYKMTKLAEINKLTEVSANEIR